MNTIPVEITITPELVKALTKALEESRVDDRSSPLTVSEFRDAIGGKLSIAHIYAMIKAGKLQKIEGMSKVLIPASEVGRFLS